MKLQTNLTYKDYPITVYADTWTGYFTAVTEIDGVTYKERDLSYKVAVQRLIKVMDEVVGVRMLR